jgi:AhpD family alkylhydroperoxidase
VSRLSRIEPEGWTDQMLTLGPEWAAQDFVANSLKAYAHQPRMGAAFLDLISAVFWQGTIDPVLKLLIRALTSQANGCRYCATHQLGALRKLGCPPKKLAELWDFETSAEFSEAERVALRFTLKFSTSHQSLTDADFTELKEHWSEADVLEIMFTSGVMGLLNQVNDSLALPVDDEYLVLGPVALDRKLFSLPD